MMAIDERTRHELHQRLDEMLGADEAATLMAHLPPTGWGDVVTREYLDLSIQAQDARLDARFAQIDTRFAQMETRFAQIDGRFGEVDGRFGEVDGRFERVEQRIDELISALSQQTRQMIFAMIGTVLSLAALARFI